MNNRKKYNKAERINIIDDWQSYLLLYGYDKKNTYEVYKTIDNLDIGFLLEHKSDLFSYFPSFYVKTSGANTYNYFFDTIQKNRISVSLHNDYYKKYLLELNKKIPYDKIFNEKDLAKFFYKYLKEKNVNFMTEKMINSMRSIILLHH